MATDRMALLEHLGNAAAGGDVDFLRTAVKTLAEVLMDVEVAAKLGAELHERMADRLGYRNGHRSRDWDTPANRGHANSCAESSGAQRSHINHRRCTGDDRVPRREDAESGERPRRGSCALRAQGAGLLARASCTLVRAPTPS
jgi:mutator family transposase